MDFDGGEKFTIYWRVDNFRNNLLKKGDFILSPSISLKTFCNTRWCFKLYPKGDGDADEGDLSVYLRREMDGGPDEMLIEYELSIYSKTFNKYVENIKRGNDFGFDYCFLELRKLNSFVITCNMRASITDLSKGNFEICKSYPQCLLLQSVSLASEKSKEILLKCEQDLLRVQRKLLTYPTQYLACSRFLTEKRTFCWPIIIQKYKCELEIPVLSFTNAPSLFLSLRVIEKENSKVLKIDVKPIEFIDPMLFLICNISVVNNENAVIDTAEEEHLFKNNETWRIDHDFFIQDNEHQFFLDKKLKCKLEFSNGEIFHEILWTKEAFLKKEEGSDFNIAGPNKIFSYEKMNKFHDITLCTLNKNFKAHKVILSAVSPVFEAMFESGMKESLSNEVRINDINSDTLEKILVFIYSGYLADLAFPSAIKLYSAADKYEITHLKNFSRSILNNNLAVENVCDVLLLADMYNDSELKDTAMEMLEMNKHAILSSSEWEKLMNKNLKLANDILMKICMQLI